MAEIIEETTIKRDGITYRVMVVPDEDASIDDADCYTDGDKATYAAGDWQFVGVIVRPVIDGTEFSDAEDSLWSVQYGTNPEWDHELLPGGTVGMAYIVDTHPVPDMIGEVRANLERLGRLIGGALAG